MPPPPDLTIGTYVPVVDPEQQYAVKGENSQRHRVRNNLPGTPQFCPLVFRTETLDEFSAMDLAHRARAISRVRHSGRDLFPRR